MDTAQLPSAASAETALNGFQMPNSDTLLGQAQQQYGVGALQSRVQQLQGLTGNLTNAIQAVDPSVTGRTAGTLTTEAQRGALVNREQQPLQTNLASDNQALGTSQNDLNTANTNAKDMVTAKQQDAQNKYNSLLQTYNIANARETAAAAAQADAAKQAEATRQFNVGEADTNANNAANRAASASSKSATPADTLLAVSQHVGGQLAGNTGRDGYVSNETWKAALNDYVSGGGNTRAFFQKYSQYVNPAYRTSYAGWANR